jgi:hypothetical protein
MDVATKRRFIVQLTVGNWLSLSSQLSDIGAVDIDDSTMRQDIKMSKWSSLARLDPSHDHLHALHQLPIT